MEIQGKVFIVTAEGKVEWEYDAKNCNDLWVLPNGNLLFILLNDGSDAIGGSFSGLAQNDIVANYGGFDWRISYSADSVGNSFTGGNDIALMAVPEPGAALLGGLGMLALLRRRRA